MNPFDVLIRDVPDPELGPLLTKLSDVGFDDPVVTQADSNGSSPPPPSAPTAADADFLPSEWRLVRELPGQAYRWPKELESYVRYTIYAADTPREGRVHIALGEAPRTATWGRDRKYFIAFLTSSSPQTPLVEFLETDDSKDTREYLAIVRGKDGGRKMYGPGDSLPDVYRREFRIETYSDRISERGSWRKAAVIAREDDHNTMLNHALIQARRRGDL
ncbi:MAG TPA: hypothetical protein VHR65_04420 [Solirubrobacterales bacterium]|jgi:hypothetical protein|nr:hypothetical protein [Solirubrobacterales bacterium]